MRRLLSKGRALVVPLDHGQVAGPVPGLEDPVGLVKRIAQSDADAVLVTPGVLEQVAGELDHLAVVLRVDGCASIQSAGPMRQFLSVAHAAEMGADAIVVNATVGGAQESVELLKLGQVAEEARRWGVPLVAEMLSARMMVNHLDFTGGGTAALPENIADDIALAARVGAEMGADVIKTRYSGDEESFRRIIASTGRPVMVAGGPQRGSSLRALLEMVDQCLSAGAEGVIIGRKVWQHPRPEAVLTALAAIVHEAASVEQALALVNERESMAVG